MGFLLLACLLQDYAPPSATWAVPLSSTRPEPDETLSLHHKTFKGGDGVLRVGGDPRFYLRIHETDWTRVLWAAGRDGLGLRYEVYLGNGVSAHVEARSFLFTGTAQLGLTWFPIESGYLPLSFDFISGRVIGPNVWEAGETAAGYGLYFWAFSGLIR